MTNVLWRATRRRFILAAVLTALLLLVVIGAVAAVWRVGWEAAAMIDPAVTPVRRHDRHRAARAVTVRSHALLRH